MKEKYTICLNGCDDYTQFTMELTDYDVELLTLVCALSETYSEYQCMPTMSIEKVVNE